MNPLIYKMSKECPHCFNRIDTGDNRCSSMACCRYGYDTQPNGAYSAVTGLGTPRVKEMIAWALANI